MPAVKIETAVELIRSGVSHRAFEAGCTMPGTWLRLEA